MSERKPLFDKDGSEIPWWDEREEFKIFTIRLSKMLSIASGRLRNKTQDDVAREVGTTRFRITKMLNQKDSIGKLKAPQEFMKIPAYAVYKYHQMTGIPYDELFGEETPKTGSSKEELLRAVMGLNEEEAAILLSMLKGVKKLK